MTALVFPGQGSQAVGMAADALAASPLAADLFAQADAALADSGLPRPLSQLCAEGPEAELRATEIAQPALLAAGYIYYRLAADRIAAPGCAAGHSLGEYTALVAAEVLDFTTALRLVRRRGELMRDAAATQPGTMAAIIGLDDDVVEALCAAAPDVAVPANFNSPGQVVVSGSAAGVAAVVAEAKAAGGRAMLLRVAGAFHSPLMADAAAQMADELARVELRPAQLPVVQNVTAQATTDPDALRAGLTAQITGSVRWTQSVRAMLTLGVTRQVECGPGTVLTGLARRIDPDLVAVAVNSVEAVDQL